VALARGSRDRALDGAVEVLAGEVAERAGVALREDPALGAEEPVAGTRGRGREARDLLVHLQGRGVDPAQLGGVAEAVHATPVVVDPVATTRGRGLDVDGLGARRHHAAGVTEDGAA